MTSPEAVREVDQFMRVEGLSAVFSLPVNMLKGCTDHSNTTYTLEVPEIDKKIAATQTGGLRPAHKAAQLEQLHYARFCLT